MTKNQQTLSAQGRVFYSNARMGMGIRFTSIEPDQNPVIEGWIEELNGEVPETPVKGDPDDTQNLIGQLENILTKLSKKKLY
jgi:hypothetical protein